MPFFLLFFILSSFIYANTVEINSTFAEKNNICIYNSTNTDLTLSLKDKTDATKTVCIYFRDYSGVLKSECDTEQVTINPQNLNKKTIYYVADLNGTSQDQYSFKIKGDDDGILAGECPSTALAKISNATPAGIANALIIAGVLAAFIFFAGIVYALTAPPFHKHDENDFYE